MEIDRKKLTGNLKLLYFVLAIIFLFFMNYLESYRETYSIYRECKNNLLKDVNETVKELYEDPENRYAIELIPQLQARKCPQKPEFLKPTSALKSLVSEQILNEDTINKLIQQTEKVKENLKSLTLDGINLKNAKLQKAKLSYSNLNNSNLYGVDLTNADLYQIKMSFSDAKKSKMTNANFEGASIKNSNFGKAILPLSSFQEAKLENVDFSKSDLSGANFNRASLLDSNLYKANLKNTKFINSNLESTYCKKADLEGADLSNSLLLFANFEKANFKNSILNGAYLRKANLEGAINLTAEQLCQAITLESATLDKELYNEVTNMCPNLLPPLEINKNSKWFFRYLLENYPTLFNKH